MAEIRLKAEKRHDSGKGVARKARSAGRVPAVLYGRDIASTAIFVDRRELALALNSDTGLNTLLDIEIDGSTTLALTKELQRHPVKGTLLHADFVKIERTQEVEVEVPVHLVGEAPGAKEGGVLEQPLSHVLIRCLPAEVPEAIDADVSGLGAGESLRVSDLPIGKFEFVTDAEEVVATITAAVSEEELEALEAGVGIGAEAAERAEEETAAHEATEPSGTADVSPAEGAEERPEES
ncbi:MAG TPA: 50S ribosomal protein L25/general stress protein Ctc [Actinomycetota bacterium]|jgi:large subunit ribosomal protein L25|nr:50S ribosomal protein L25/general stress protein Ctc [Actinomycetota bacterium]